MKPIILLLAGTLAAFVSQAAVHTQNSAMQTQGSPLSESARARITEEVRHQLVLLPYYGVFDNFAYTVSSDGTVTLLGQVSQPTLKSDAERVVRGVEGVTRVENQIEVLPTSPMDDQIRRATFRAIYGNDVLSMYALRAVPPIHIIVSGGHVTLEGVVARQMDKQLSETQARTVPNVFSVTNNLQVEDKDK